MGKKGRLGESIRCVVSVSMLTEGWDVSTVTHVLGVRAFGTQLLCEQVIGRALRRQSYDLVRDEEHPEGLFPVEYADILGIPFDFAAKPVIVKPTPPQNVIRVSAVRPERDALEIRFPRVQGYRVELPRDRLEADFNDDSVFVLNPDVVGPSRTHNAGIIGEGVDLDLKHLNDMRYSTLVMHLTKRLLYNKWRDQDQEPQLYLFPQLSSIVKQWLEKYLVCVGGTYPAQLMYQELADIACERITAAITRKTLGKSPVKAILDPYNPEGSTSHVNFTTTKMQRWQTDARRCHINWVILDSDWEAEFCRVAEAHPRVRSYVKNHSLGFEVPYRMGSANRIYRPDFIVRVEDGHGEDDLLNLVVEIKGYRGEDAKDKKSTMDTYWIPGVNNSGNYGRWAFAEIRSVYAIESEFEKEVEGHFNQVISELAARNPYPSDSTDLRMLRLVSDQFGESGKRRLAAEAIWGRITSSEAHAFNFRDLPSVAQSAQVPVDDVLEILSVLAGRGNSPLALQLRAIDNDHSEITPATFIEMLTAWWRRKELSDEDWKAWSSSVEVSWSMRPIERDR